MDLIWLRFHGVPTHETVEPDEHPLTKAIKADPILLDAWMRRDIEIFLHRRKRPCVWVGRTKPLADEMDFFSYSFVVNQSDIDAKILTSNVPMAIEHPLIARLLLILYAPKTRDVAVHTTYSGVLGRE